MSSSSLRAFPSDYDSPEQVAQLQNDHFVVSKTTSTFSEPSTVATTPIAPPLMARPSTQTKTNEHAMTRVGAAAPPQTTLPSIWEREKPIIIQGGSQRTWSFVSGRHNNMIQVHTRTEGNPMYATVDLWQGPGNVPQKIKMYSEDGLARPFRCFLPIVNNVGGVSNSINIRNTASTEFPLEAILEAPTSQTKNGLDIETNQRMNLLASSQNNERHIQGGSTVTERFEPNVKSLQIYVSSEGRPVNCRIELVSGPNNIKQVMEVYSDEGQARPFYAVLETPGYLGGIIRVINTGTIEFPFSTIITPWEVVSKKEMYKGMNLGGTSNPIEINGSGSSFGNVVAQMGGFGNSIGMGTGGYGAAPTQKKRVFAPAAKEKAAAAPTSASKKMSERKKLPLPPITSNSNKTSEQEKAPLPPLQQSSIKKKNKNSRRKNKDVMDDDDGVGSTEKILMNIWDKKLESEGDKKARRKEKQKSEAAADAKTILYDTDQNSSGKSKNKQNFEFIDADIDMECVIKEGDIDVSVECAAVEDDIEAKIETEVGQKLTVADDIEAKIEAEVERKLKESKIQEEKERVATEAKAAAAAAASLEESIRKEKEFKEMIQKEKELKEKIQKEKELKEHIEAEAKARFDARVLQEQKEIESQRKEIKRMNTEMKEKEARLRIEKQEEIARKKQMEENNNPKVAPIAPLQQQQQRRVHHTQTKKPAHVVLDIDDAFK